jgi:hypothetical protein
MRLLSLDHLEKMVQITLETEEMLPEGYQLEEDDSPKGVAAYTIYSFAHRIRDLEAELADSLERIDKAHTETASVQAGMGMAADHLRRRAEKAEADLRKFYKCEDDAICEYPRRVGRIHDGIGDIQYQIWHKES